MNLTSHDLACLQKIEKLIIKNIKEKYTTATLAQMMRMNEDKLKKGFKHMYGYPIFEYRRMKKLERARSLLEETELSEVDIAKKVGFKSLPSFIKAFKKKYNRLPNTFRKQ